MAHTTALGIIYLAKSGRLCFGLVNSVMLLYAAKILFLPHHFLCVASPAISTAITLSKSAFATRCAGERLIEQNEAGGKVLAVIHGTGQSC
jgi:hypothetical protein